MTSPALRPPSLATLILLSALSVISLNMFLPSLPAIAREFEVDYALVTLAISGYAVATAVIQLIAGPLSDRFGRRPVILVSIGLYILASIGCFSGGGHHHLFALPLVPGGGDFGAHHFDGGHSRHQ